METSKSSVNGASCLDWREYGMVGFPLLASTFADFIKNKQKNLKTDIEVEEEYHILITNVGIFVFLLNANMGPKKVKTGESSSARPVVDEDYVPPMDVEEQLRESSRVGASSSGAGATSSRGRKKPGSDLVPVVLGVPDTPLLRDLGGHISAICRTQERSPIMGWRCSWKPVLTFYQKTSPSLRDALGRTPLGPFLTIPRIQSDRRLVAALCERWFGETNTFHFPCCELAIIPSIL
ncbi:hypothetical protein HHK36_020157 [Tetracentron sinense]|uniref:Aminotransferase-like plant mobile domain-containing protein n=1 Tax=Tetracentron sinense TaxID=13715 RepID=A0A834YUK5_TETSI|nr:hypothetical protein HHK36_020157 [Tetracentron sinense]